MNLSEIRPTLGDIGVQPSSTMGQNFLHDGNLARWIVDQLGEIRDEPVLEVGPGLGALTGGLLEKGARLLAVEKDRKLAGYLASRYAETGIEVLAEDAMDFDLRMLWERGVKRWIGNLPYYVSTPIVMRLSGIDSPLEQGIIMVQHEMAERLCASPRCKAYGVPTVLLASRWHAKVIKRVGPSCFYPVPQVDSAVVSLVRRDPHELGCFDARRLQSLVRLGFSQRRKQLRKTLSGAVREWEEWCGMYNVPTTARAEELSIEHWVSLTRWGLDPETSEAQKPTEEWFDVVDDQDRPVDKKTRADVHVNNLRHRAAHVFIFDRSGQLFLQKRSPWKDRHPGVWDSSAAGHLDAGEGYDEAAAREVKEEMGVRVRVEPVAKIAACEGTGWEFVTLYRGESEGPFRLPAAEVETGMFFPVPAIERWIATRPQDFAPGFLECFRVWRLSEQ